MQKEKALPGNGNNMNDDEFVGYVSDIKNAMDRETWCDFGWKVGTCYCTIRSGFDEATFVISEDLTFDENVLDKDCVNIITYLRQDDTFEVVDNGGEAADAKRIYFTTKHVTLDQSTVQNKELNDVLLEQQNSMRTLICMLKAKREMYGYGDTNVGVRNIWILESNRSISINGNDSKKQDMLCVDEYEGKGNDGLVNAVFGSRFEIRKLGRMDVTSQTKLLGF
ncbi:hypothetical protein C2G38_2165082 [Gigaspora rosea]|uniref:Uncharacterized protein n=1 Tax=Gigaspora rosea TaxID=44941 RepID=A0A397W392_9GLOM|nr:hypothetical protein C2G38_2165082 [Gigaspora rosea]